MDIKATIKQARGDYRDGGLALEEKEDSRNWSLLEFGGVNLGKVPDKDFKVPNIPPVKDQSPTDFCVPFSISYTIEQDLKSQNIYKRMSAPFLFAATKKLKYGGNYSGFGLSIPKTLSVLQKIGICREELYPFKGTRNRMANHNNIPQEAWDDALNYKLDKPFFKVDLFRDKFDNFCAGMYHWNEMIITGMYMYSGYYVDSKGRLIMRKTGSKFGHAFDGNERETIDGVVGMRFQNSYLNMPTFWLSANEVRREMYNGYIVPSITRDVADIIKKYAGKVIMAKKHPESFSNPNVYLVMKGQKRRLKNERAAWAHSVRLWKDVIKIEDSELAIIPTGDDVGWEEGQSYELVKEIFSLSLDRFKALKI